MENSVHKRRRPAVACTECRRRKVKCDRNLPCGPCTQSSLMCAYRPLPTANLQPDQNTYQPILNYAGQGSSASGFNTTADQFGELNSSFCSAGPMSVWGLSGIVAPLDAPQVKGYGKSQVGGSNMMHHTARSPPGSESDQLSIFTAPSSEISINGSLSAPPGRIGCSFLRISSFGPNQHYIQTTVGYEAFLEKFCYRNG